MYSSCIFCRISLGTNSLIEQFPVGKRLAFDQAKGRLWAVCRACGGWNLAPIDERWEAIEACEKAFRGTRVRLSTDNIGLASHPSGLELVRIGPALRPEFAAWRYGPRIRRRRRNTLLAAGAGIVIVGAASIGLPLAAGISGVGWWTGKSLIGLWKAAEKKRRVLDLPEYGLTIRRRHLPHIGWHPAQGSTPWSVDVVLPDEDKKRLPAGANRIELRGAEGMRLASIALNHLNRTAGRRNELADAVEWIGAVGSPFGGAEDESDPTFLAERDRLRLGLEKRGLDRLYGPMNTGDAFADMPAYQRLAFELAANEDQERLWLTGQLRVLERYWREAEEVAAISDKLALPEETEAQLERLKRDR